MRRPSPSNLVAFCVGIIMGATGLTHLIYWCIIAALLVFGRHPIILHLR